MNNVGEVRNPLDDICRLASSMQSVLRSMQNEGYSLTDREFSVCDQCLEAIKKIDQEIDLTLQAGGTWQ